MAAREAPEGPVHYWVDGALVRRDDDAFDPAALEVGLCYTTARVERGAPRWAARHAARLARDARHHGLEPPPAEAVIAALEGLARAEFGHGAGIVRLQLGRDGHGVPRLVGVPRPLGHDPATWRLGVAPVVHPGPGARGGAKLLGQPFVDAARRWLLEADCDEALLFDAEGRLVEGSRTNVIFVDARGRPGFADRALGGVAGLGLEVCREAVPELAPARVTRAELALASEIVAVNAVRGPRPCVTLDGAPVGTGRPGPFAARLEAALARA